MPDERRFGTMKCMDIEQMLREAAKLEARDCYRYIEQYNIVRNLV